MEEGEHSSVVGCEKLVEHRHKKLKRQQKWLLALELQLKCNKRSANSRRVLQGQCRGSGHGDRGSLMMMEVAPCGLIKLCPPRELSAGRDLCCMQSRNDFN